MIPVCFQPDHSPRGGSLVTPASVSRRPRGRSRSTPVHAAGHSTPARTRSRHAIVSRRAQGPMLARSGPLSAPSHTSEGVHACWHAPNRAARVTVVVASVMRRPDAALVRSCAYSCVEADFLGEAIIQVILDEELERLVGAGPYERSDQRVDVRNGRYDRRWSRCCTPTRSTTRSGT